MSYTQHLINSYCFQCEKCGVPLDITSSVYLEALSYLACGLSSGDIVVGLVHNFLTHALFKCDGQILISIGVLKF